MLIGAHMSVAGGLDRAVERGQALGCRTMQIFTRNASQWSAPPLDDAVAARFRQALAGSSIAPVISHDSYLINLASPVATLRRRSIRTFADELARAETLGLFGVVTHPGAHMGRGEEEGLARVGDALLGILEATPEYAALILIENTAGQGSGLGWRFDHLAFLLERTGRHPRIGFCLDTCHLHAAGYDLTTEAGWRQTWRDFDRTVGRGRLQCLHLNDSKNPLGSRVDRHTGIGEGTMGLFPFRRIMTDRRLARIPKILETPKGPDGVALDRKNLAILRRLARAEEEGDGNARESPALQKAKKK